MERKRLQNIKTESDQNNLKTYLQKQMMEYEEECRNKKALFEDLLAHIEDCKSQIDDLNDKEDRRYTMLSPIAVESPYKTQIVRIEGQLETYEKQKEKYLSDIRFYEMKIQEIEMQLEAYEKNEAKQEIHTEAADSSDEQADLPVASENQADTAVKTKQSYDTKELLEQLEQIEFLQRQTEALQNQIALLKEELEQQKAESEALHMQINRRQTSQKGLSDKIRVIKGYVTMDPLRAKLELERLEKELTDSKME